MLMIKYNTMYNYSSMQNLLEHVHQYTDSDYPKEILIKPSDINTTMAWLNRIRQTKVKFKSNSIKLVDIVIYYPFHDTNQEKLEQWKEDSVDCFVNKFGIENIMAATYHSTTKPHIHFAVIPVVNNNLSWSYYTQRDTIRIPALEYEYINEILQV